MQRIAAADQRTGRDAAKRRDRETHRPQRIVDAAGSEELTLRGRAKETEPARGHDASSYDRDAVERPYILRTNGGLERRGNTVRFYHHATGDRESRQVQRVQNPQWDCGNVFHHRRSG